MLSAGQSIIVMVGQPLPIPILLTPAEIEQLLSAAEGLALIRGQWVEDDHEKLKAALAFWDKTRAQSPGGLSLADSLRILSGLDAGMGNAVEPTTAEWMGLVPGAWLEQTLAALRDPTRIGELAAIPGLRG